MLKAALFGRGAEKFPLTAGESSAIIPSDEKEAGWFVSDLTRPPEARRGSMKGRPSGGLFKVRIRLRIRFFASGEAGAAAGRRFFGGV